MLSSALAPSLRETRFALRVPLSAASDDHAEPAPLFKGVSRWPRINDLLEGKALTILASGGIPAWLGMGGRCGADGRLGFGAVSSPALDVVEQLAGGPGFLWIDAAGSSWAVHLNGNRTADESWLCEAVSYRGAARLLDPDARHRAMRTLGTQVANYDQPARPWDDADRARHGRLARALHRLQLVDSAVGMLARLLAQVEKQRSNDVFLQGDDIVAGTPVGQPEAHHNQAALALVATLHAVMGLEIAQLRLGQIGWDPQVTFRSTAVTEVEKEGRAGYRVRVTPRLADLLGAFAAPTGVPMSSRLLSQTMNWASSAVITAGPPRRAK